MTRSLSLLAAAMRSIPVNAAYAVWTGTGAVGTALASILLFGETTSALRLASLALLLAGMVGLKIGAQARSRDVSAATWRWSRPRPCAAHRCC